MRFISLFANILQTISYFIMLSSRAFLNTLSRIIFSYVNSSISFIFQKTPQLTISLHNLKEKHINDKFPLNRLPVVFLRTLTN